MVSVIIPTYNNNGLVQRAVCSVLAQTCGFFECIVVDDGSTDGTVNDLISRFGGLIRIVELPKNGGVGLARQAGLVEALGDFVVFLDADDVLDPDFIRMTMCLQAQTDADIVYPSFKVAFTNTDTEIYSAGEYDMTGEATVQLHFTTEHKFLTGKLIRKSLCDKVVWSDRRIGEDVQTLFFLMYKAKRVRSTDYVGYIHCFREGSLLANKPVYYCFCQSALATMEMVDFLEKEGDERLYNHVLDEFMQCYDSIEKQRVNLFSKDQLEENEAEWRKISKWAKDHKNKIPKIKRSK